MASMIEVARLSKVIDETQVDDGVKLGIARRIADVLQTNTRNFHREQFIDEATKTKRAFARTY